MHSVFPLPATALRECRQQNTCRAASCFLAYLHRVQCICLTLQQHKPAMHHELRHMFAIQKSLLHDACRGGLPANFSVPELASFEARNTTLRQPGKNSRGEFLPEWYAIDEAGDRQAPACMACATVLHPGKHACVKAWACWH